MTLRRHFIPAKRTEPHFHQQPEGVAAPVAAERRKEERKEDRTSPRSLQILSRVPAAGFHWKTIGLRSPESPESTERTERTAPESRTNKIRNTKQVGI
ncbi:hypothetical protein EYF80_046356 [Liparis tanakae]|uniref:Uncharacterized protein n=1 Tax=Liparis tanakae TaxID=230148 RepID=A0A4Z2FQB9_9TELE|nr:hypothetical protein EYF80_046356 [Liparis tanakae]